MSPARRLRLTAIIITLGCLASMAISHRLWLGAGRSFPRVPMVAALPDWSWPIESSLTIGLAIVIIGVPMARAAWSRRLCWFAVLLGMVMMLFDQMRMQPWFLQYMLMWAVLGSRGVDRPQADDVLALRTLRLVIACIYIYSGLHKINTSFFEETAVLVLEPLSNLLGSGNSLKFLGYLMPVLEVCIGIGLLLRPARKLAVMAAIGMHVSILLLIGPLGRWHNAVVWPWNLTMMAVVIALFWWRDIPATISSPGAVCRWVCRSAVGLACVLPIGGIVGLIDVYLSWGMYAGAPPLAALEFSPAMVQRLVPGVREQVVTRSSGTQAIFVLDWSFADLQVVYPEERIIEAVAAWFVPLMQSDGDMKVYVIPRPARFSNERTRMTVPIEALPPPRRWAVKAGEQAPNN